MPDHRRSSQQRSHRPPKFDFHAHVQGFNEAVETGEWSRFAERFAPDAIMEFVGPPLGPFTGRQAIHEAYVVNPPDDTIEVTGPVTVESNELVAPFKWSSTGEAGTMRVTERGGKVARLVVVFGTS